MRFSTRSRERPYRTWYLLKEREKEAYNNGRNALDWRDWHNEEYLRCLDQGKTKEADYHRQEAIKCANERTYWQTKMQQLQAQKRQIENSYPRFFDNDELPDWQWD